jgi:S1-C subfamily serine protease
MHDKQPYGIAFLANTKNYEKYLPEFEKIVKSFTFASSPSSETENMSENQNGTNTATNFSGVNLNRPYIGIAGLSLTPDLSKQIGLNQTRGFLLTFIAKGSPADNAGLRAGTNTTTIKGRDIIVG